jgi:hypothetical protein
MHLCGNVLENVKVPIVLDGFVPFLVGVGDQPVVWLTGLANPRPPIWRTVVFANSSFLDAVKVSAENQKTVVSLANGMVILSCAILGKDEAQIDAIDLRPIGMMVYGGAEGLWVGVNRYFGNVFENLEIMMKVSTSAPAKA